MDKETRELIDRLEHERHLAIIAHMRVALAPAPPGLECEHCAGDDDAARRSWAYLHALDSEETRPRVSLPGEPCDTPWVPARPTVEGVSWHSSRTMYHWDGKGEDPNRPRALCVTCAIEHHERWDDMWSNVPGYGG